MNNYKAGEPQAAAQNEPQTALLSSLHKQMMEHVRKVFREISTSRSLDQCKRDLLKG